MLWLEQKYIGIVSSRLEKFRRKNSNTYNFRCPICNDSAQNKSKTRGYIYLTKGSFRFHCHNCGASMSVLKFIKSIDPNLYYEFLKEKIADQKQEKTELEVFEEKFEKPKFVKHTALNSLKKISALRHDHPAKLYIDNRKIPTEYHYKLFYASNFKEWVDNIYPGKLPDNTPKEPRLVIPFLDKDKNLFGFQGRSFRKDSSLRYITIMLDDSKPKIYGLDSIDESKNVFVFEGPIDSMFISNSIATAGGDLKADLGLTSIPKDNIIIVYDNEPRNVHTVKKINKSIEDGFKVCLWPSNIKEKDINDMILAGYTVSDIESIINKSTLSGLEAKLYMTFWKKC